MVDRAVVDDLAVLIAPGRVVDGARVEPRRVAGDDPVDEADRVRPRHAVLVQGLTSMSGRLGSWCTRCRGSRRRHSSVVAGPLAPLLLAVQRRGAGMERGPDAQRSSSVADAQRVSPRRRSGGPRAAGQRREWMTCGWRLSRARPTHHGDGRSAHGASPALPSPNPGGMAGWRPSGPVRMRRSVPQLRRGRHRRGHNGLVSAAYLARAGMSTWCWSVATCSAEQR